MSLTTRLWCGSFTGMGYVRENISLPGHLEVSLANVLFIPDRLPWSICSGWPHYQSSNMCYLYTRGTTDTTQRIINNVHFKRGTNLILKVGTNNLTNKDGTEREDASTVIDKIVQLRVTYCKGCFDKWLHKWSFLLFCRGWETDVNLAMPGPVTSIGRHG